MPANIELDNRSNFNLRAITNLPSLEVYYKENSKVKEFIQYQQKVVNTTTINKFNIAQYNI